MAKTYGIMDSGMGGVSVLNALREQSPQDHFMYVADLKFVPYGKKKTEVVRDRVKAIHDFFQTLDVDHFVIACNTATIAAKDMVFTLPTTTIVEPMIKEVCLGDQSDPVLVLGTDLTIASGYYQNALRERGFYVDALGSSVLVDLVEHDKIDTEESHRVVKQHLQPMMKTSFKQVVLGCTHFPWLKKEIGQCFPEATLVDGTMMLKQMLELTDSKGQTPSFGTLEIISTKIDQLSVIERYVYGPINQVTITNL